MDLNRLDDLARVLGAPAPRRRLLATLPALGGLFGVLAGDANARQHKKHKKHKKPCKAEPNTQTCAGKCGNVPNNCKQTVNCGSCGCTGTDQCPGGQICNAGSCKRCDVCQDGSCDFTSVQGAIDSTTPQLTTIRVCPGRYFENAGSGDAVLITRALTLIGAGDDAGLASNTTLRPVQADQRVIRVASTGGVRLDGLRISGGTGPNGTGALIFQSTVTMANCTVTENHPTGAGGGLHILDGSQVTLLDTLITVNSSQAVGGGIEVQASTVTFDTLSQVTNNTSPDTGGVRSSGSTITLPNVNNVTGNSAPNCSGDSFMGPGAVCANP